MNIKKIHQLIKQIYTTVNHAGSFTSARKIKHILKTKYGENVSENRIQEWLNEQRVYTLHRRAIHTFKRNPTMVCYIDEQWQADLLFLPELNGKEIGMLLCIDIASRYIWGKPIRNKSGEQVTKAMKDILIEAKPRCPWKLQTDDGKEFFNSTFQKLMKDFDINHFSTYSDMKAALVERAVRSIKEKIYRILENPKYKNKWVNLVDDCLESYNATFHESIQMAPNEVNESNIGIVLNNQFKKYWIKDRTWKKPLFSIGDKVRISKARRIFKKGYKGKWKEELFIIDKIKQTHPSNTYKLIDLNNEPLLGTFYAIELQKINADASTEYQIEKILRERKKNGKKEMLVRWLGYSKEFDSWVPAENITDVD